MSMQCELYQRRTQVPIAGVRIRPEAIMSRGHDIMSMQCELYQRRTQVPIAGVRIRPEAIMAQGHDIIIEWKSIPRRLLQP